MSRRVGVAGVALGIAVVASVPALALLGSVPERQALSSPWSGAVVSAPVADTPDQPAAVALLRRAAAAARTTAYSGTAAVQEWAAGGGVARVVDVTRVPGEGTTVRVRGEESAPMVTRDSDVPSVAPGDAGRLLGLPARNFAVAVGGRDTVAGRPATVVVARRAHGVLAARFWIDSATGLVLRREVYDAAGRIATTAAFLSLHLGTPAVAPTSPPAAVRTGTSRAVEPQSGESREPGETGEPGPTGDDGYGGGELADTTVPLAQSQVARWRAAGWRCPEALPDGLSLVEVRRGSDGSHLQLVYSDGLATLSLFEQQGRLDADRLDGFARTDVAGVAAWTRPGVPAQVVWQSGEQVFTLVADAPADVVAAVVAALPGEPATQAGLVDRVHRGLERLLEFVRR